jgi:hypothetical protein
LAACAGQTGRRLVEDGAAGRRRQPDHGPGRRFVGVFLVVSLINLLGVARSGPRSRRAAHPQPDGGRAVRGRKGAAVAACALLFRLFPVIKGSIGRSSILALRGR